MEIAVFASTMVVFFLLFGVALPGTHWKEAEARQRSRRLAEHKLNARLLRFSL